MLLLQLPALHRLGFLEYSSSRAIGWVFCVLSDGFPVFFSIQRHRFGFPKIFLYSGLESHLDPQARVSCAGLCLTHG